MASQTGEAKNHLKRVGVLGGTFDPVHYGHLNAAEEARELLDLAEVLFVPSGYPPHKKRSAYLSADKRFEMTQLAVANNPAFSVSRVEMDSPGPAYTVNTLSLLQEALPDSELYFITGTDMFLDLPNWRDPEGLLDRHHFVAVARPGWDLSQAYEQRDRTYPSYREHIHILTVPGVAISATEIRARVQAGRSIRYLVPEAVAKYILENGLYR